MSPTIFHHFFILDGLIGDRGSFQGVRDMRSLAEQSPQPVGQKHGLCVCQPLPFSSIDEVVAAAGELSPATAEGYVVVFGEYERLKVKAPAYVAAALLPKSEAGWHTAAAGAAMASRLLSIARLGTCAMPPGSARLLVPNSVLTAPLWGRVFVMQGRSKSSGQPFHTSPNG